MKSGRFAIIPARAIEDKDLPPPALVLLSCLGTYGDTDGYCVVRRAKIAARLGITKAAVSKYLRVLESLGYLEVSRRLRADGGNSANEYRILFDAVLPAERRRGEEPEENEEGEGVTARGYQGVTQEVTRGVTASGDQGVTHSVTPKNALSKNGKKNMRSAERDPDFEVWYEEYPNKKARGDAEKAYPKAKARFGAETLLEGLRRWKANYRGEKKFIPYPATWLNDQRWLDEPDAPKATAPPAAQTEPWEARLAGFMRNGFWKADWGPRPGDPKCRVPREILERLAA